MAKYINYETFKNMLLREIEKIPIERIERYSFGVPIPDSQGVARRGGARIGLKLLEQVPYEDVELKVYGHIEDYGLTIRCSRCKIEFPFVQPGMHTYIKTVYKRCPFCGAHFGK